MATCEGTHLLSSLAPYPQLRALMKKLVAMRVIEQKGRAGKQMKTHGPTARALTPKRAMIGVLLIRTETFHIVQATTATTTKIITVKAVAQRGMDMTTRSLMGVQCTDELAG